MDTDFEFDFNAATVTESDPPPFTRDTEPMPFNDPDALTCKTCGVSITYGGRGPKPKYCAEHKRKSTSTNTRAKKKTGTDYREGIAGLLQLPMGALAVVGISQNKPELIADAAVIEKYTPAIATAVSDLANDQPQIAAVLDKILKVGPYGALLAAVMPMAVQILANHKVIPVGVMGAVSVETILGMPEPGMDSEPDNA